MKKRFILLLTIFLCGVFLASCGGGKENGETGETGESAWRGIMPGMEDLSEITERTRYYDIMTETVEFTRSDRTAKNPNGERCVYWDTVIYGEEAVQIWEAAHTDNTVDIWLYRADESWELLLSGISGEYISENSHTWYLDSEGNCYCWTGSVTNIYGPGSQETVRDEALTKFLASGEVQFIRKWDSGGHFTGISQLEDGRIYLGMTDSDENLILGEMDPATGETPEEKQIKLDATYLHAKMGSGPETLLLYNMNFSMGDGILSVSPSDGKISFVLNFTGTSYANVYAQMYLKDFKMLPDGSYLMLYTASGVQPLPRAALDRLTVSEVEKTPIILRGQFNGDPWISAQAAQFNRQSDKYHVIVEDCGSGNDQEDFARLTSVQIAAGKGPDIISGYLMEDYLLGMLKNGALEELSPYLERSGIREEDYLPCAFGLWREGDGIYGVTPRSLGLSGYMMDASLLDGEEEPGIQELVDALLSAGRTDAVFIPGWDSQGLLSYFLGGSETLWGMVDWEEGTCDFSGELFANILEAAALFGDSPRKANAVSIAERRFQGIPLNLFAFQGSKEMEDAGKVVCGELFDDGCHLWLSSDSTMGINRNSANKEGAWEFLRFLFSEEAQLYQDAYFPVRKDCLDAWLKAQLDKVETTRNVWEKNEKGESILVVYPYTDEYNTEEKAEEFRQELEEARPYPMRTRVILEFIREEAADYFSGSKSAEAVGEVIERRVQIYLDENR